MEKSPLNRLEVRDGTANRHKKITYQKNEIDELLVRIVPESYAEPLPEIMLDVDVTDFALHGQQEGRFFHGDERRVVAKGRAHRPPTESANLW